jgi:glycosyltransferase involved in cell wall biosynthesis
MARMASKKTVTDTRLTCALLVPCRNGAPYLPRLFASAHAQTRPFDEIWLFDDGSTDRSSAVAAESGARVLRSDFSIGPSAARNRLIAACTCDWLHFHDADDTMEPRYLERVSELARPGTDLVICDMPWIEEETGRRENHWTYDSAALARHPTAYLLLNTVGGINGFYRREALTAIGGFDETLKFWEDLELNLRLAARGTRTAVINEDLVTAFRRRSSYSNANLGAVWRVKLRIMANLLPTADRTLLSTIATEAETIAERLATLGLWQDVPSALKLARQAGGNPPQTHNPLLRLIKPVLPSSWSFRLQHILRKKLKR